MNTVEIEAFFQSTGAIIERTPTGSDVCNCGKDHGTTPHYNPNVDKIFVDERTFETEERYWATVAHELTHWTGHPSRLDRLDHAGMGDPRYSFEEIIAQTGALILCENVLDITTPEIREWHQSYILGYLQDFPQHLWERVVDEATEKAAEAVHYILSRATVRPELEAIAA